MAKKNQENAENVEGTAALQPVEAPKVEIIRGRMPVAVVALIRFSETETSTSACADKYRTTVGKVDDIRKNRNFAYVDESFVPTEQQVADAKVYLEQLSDDNALNAIQALEAMGVAADASDFEAKRTAMRKTTKKAEPKDEVPGEEEVAEDDFEDSDLEDLTE